MGKHQRGPQGPVHCNQACESHVFLGSEQAGTHPDGEDCHLQRSPDRAE